MWREGEGKSMGVRPDRPFSGRSEADLQHLSSKWAPLMGALGGGPGRFVRTAAERSRRGRTGRPPWPAMMNGARWRAGTTSVVRTRLNAGTDSGPGPFRVASANAQPSNQQALRDPGIIAAHTRFPAETPCDRTPDARDER